MDTKKLKQEARTHIYKEIAAVAELARSFAEKGPGSDGQVSHEAAGLSDLSQTQIALTNALVGLGSMQFDHLA